MDDGHKGYFEVACCGRRRGLINGVLICSRCDYDHNKATIVPNESRIADVPAGTWFLYVRPSGD